MGVEVAGVVVKPVGESNGIAGMKSFGKFSHHLLQAGVQNVIGIYSRIHQRIVLFLGHGKDQPMRNGRAFRKRRKFVQVVLPGFGNAAFALRVGKLGRRRAGAVRITANFVMQKPACVNLSEFFLGSVVRETFELFADLFLQPLAFPQGNFPVGSFVQIFQVQPPASGGFTRENLPVFHVRESMASSVRSIWAAMRSMTAGSMTSLAETE